MLVLYRIYQLFVLLPLGLFFTVLTAVLTIVGCTLGGGRWWGYYPAHWWARVMCVLSLVRVRVCGRENICPDQSYVFVANHQGAYDIFSVYGYLNHQFRWMMKASLRGIPLVGYACDKAHHIYVDGSTPSRLRHTMSRAERVLSGGCSLMVFPEGARTWDGHMRRFKRGAFTLASEFNLPVVPVAIDGAFDVMPRTSRIPRWGTITITILPPIAPPVATDSDTARVAAESREAISGVLPERFR